MLALIDTDILTYRVGFVTQDTSLSVACHSLDEMIRDIVETTKADEFQLYLTASQDETAFRKKCYPLYKANRTAPRPVHYDGLREYMKEKYNASFSVTIEADDAISISSRLYTADDVGHVIVSIDKDLNQIPGTHYHFVKKEHYYVSEEEGLRYFYKQLLTGDTADNVKGVPGIGEKKAERILSECETEQHMFDAVRNAYSSAEEMLRNAEALWMLKLPYPQGRWCYSQYGGILVQEIIDLYKSLGNPLPSGLEFIAETEVG